MTKTKPTDTAPTVPESSMPVDATMLDATIPQTFWLLKEGTPPRSYQFSVAILSAFLPSCEHRFE